MIIGITATSLTFIALIVSTAAYYIYHLRNEDSVLKIGRYGFYLAGALIVFQSILLMWGILTHQFQWTYVASYSSRDLPVFYLVSTFWAGQEGTFLLWLLFGTVYGIVILRRKEKNEALIMTFYNLVLAYIAMILIKKNPFEYVWNINPAMFGPGQIPVDGNGLNPLLQDPWMVIHPPILFSGYSATMILFAFAMSALIKKEYDGWIKSVYPYSLFTALALGAGIILGGYWAYTTLGWGGYWGWDPVENSSLIPWLTSLALVHGMIIQRRQGGMKKTNIFLALLTFILVLYGSFLTRSGVLTDFSVHSFGSSELNQYLIGFVLLFLAISIFTFLYRINEVRSEKVQNSFFTRESFILFGILVLIILSIFTFIGTSSPIITGLMGEAANVSIDYYNMMSGPLAIIIILLVALAPLLRWKSDSADKFKKAALHGLISLVLGAGAYLLGVKDIIPLIIVILSIFAILINGQLAWNLARKKNLSFAGYLTHVGLGFMFIGIITSSVYDSHVKVTLPKDMPRIVMGYSLEYGGKVDSPDGKDKVLIKINGKQSHAKFYWSDYSRAYMVAPSVTNMLLRDLYISPIQIIPKEEVASRSGKNISLKKNTPHTLNDNVTLLFKGYEMGTHGMNDGTITVAAVIDVLDNNNNVLETIRPTVKMVGDKKEMVPATITQTKDEIFLAGINVEQQSISLKISSNDPNNPHSVKAELLAVEVSIKPLINILWLGTILIILGFFLAGYNYWRKPVV